MWYAGAKFFGQLNKLSCRRAGRGAEAVVPSADEERGHGEGEEACCVTELLLRSQEGMRASATGSVSFIIRQYIYVCKDFLLE